ncbi:MAG: hypothetical protein ACEPOV_03730 [Hyphomicrobiales bacterium]
MKIYNTLLILLSCLILACSNPKKEIVKHSKLVYFIIYDSIDIPDSKYINITDYNPKNGLFLGIFNKELRGFTKEGQQFSFDQFGMGVKEYSYDIAYNANAIFTDDSNIMINSYNDLMFFDFKGNYIKHIRIDTCPYYYGRKILSRYKDQFLFDGDNTFDWRDTLKDSTHENVSTPEKKNFFLFNPQNKESHAFAGIKKDHRLYKENNSHYSYNPLVAFNKRKNEINILYSVDHQIYKYNLEQPQDHKIFSLNPENYHEVLLFDRNYRENEEIKSYLSSQYKYLYANGDTTITIFRQGVDEDIIEEYEGRLNDPQGFFEFASENFNHIIEYYINEKKQTADISIPYPYKAKFIGDKNHIICQIWNQEITKNNVAYKRLYFARLESTKK